jgi:phosphoenolpyruvate synthase/pyruvate phosphate dikinase
MTETSEFRIQYHKERLLNDSGFRNTFITKIAQIGVTIEDLYGKVPQDIEGAYFNNQYYVVQTRPQV